MSSKVLVDCGPIKAFGFPAFYGNNMNAWRRIEAGGSAVLALSFYR